MRGAAIPDTLDIVISLQQVLMSPHGADTSEIDALIESGFVVSHVTVLDIAPLYLTFYISTDASFLRQCLWCTIFAMCCCVSELHAW